MRPQLASLLLLALTAASSKAATPRVLAVDVDGMIHPVTVEILSRAIQQAKQDDAALLLVRLNTPGGLMDAMRESIEKIVAAPMPVVTFVAPSGARAASAGFFINKSGQAQFAATPLNFVTFNIAPALRYEFGRERPGGSQFSRDMFVEASYTFTRFEDKEANTTANRNFFMVRFFAQHALLE